VRRIPWLGLAAIAMIVTGIVIAFVGHNTLRWAPPPAPPTWAAAAGTSASPAPVHPARMHPAPARRTPTSRPTGHAPTAGTPARGTGTSHPPSCRGAPPAEIGLPHRSLPVGLDIPAIRVHASVIALGLNRNGTLAVPPLGHPGLTSWYDEGPAPGQRGAAAILGHVDATGVGPAVFYNLGNLRPGAKIYVRLRDGQTIVFETYSVALFSKARFPTAKVFGYTSWPTLRLITCGGEFDQNSRHYAGNVVAFASYVGSLK
jgi:hypothetical protein